MEWPGEDMKQDVTRRMSVEQLDRALTTGEITPGEDGVVSRDTELFVTTRAFRSLTGPPLICAADGGMGWFDAHA